MIIVPNMTPLRHLAILITFTFACKLREELKRFGDSKTFRFALSGASG
jgi:hypothetical protein